MVIEHYGRTIMRMIGKDPYYKSPRFAYGVTNNFPFHTPSTTHELPMHGVNNREIVKTAHMNNIHKYF
jgi:hypothetical protein